MGSGAGLCLLVQWEYANRRARLVGAGTDRAVLNAVRARVLAGTGCYAVALVTAAFSPTSALVLFAVMPLLYLLPTRIDIHVKRT